MNDGTIDPWGQYVPDHTLAGLDRYVNHGIPPGDFLYCVLTNDLVGAFARADDENYRNLGAIVRYVYNELPSGCWRTPEKIERWIEEKHQARLAKLKSNEGQLDDLESE